MSRALGQCYGGSSGIPETSFYKATQSHSREGLAESFRGRSILCRHGVVGYAAPTKTFLVSFVSMA